MCMGHTAGGEFDRGVEEAAGDGEMVTDSSRRILSRAESVVEPVVGRGSGTVKMVEEDVAS